MYKFVMLRCFTLIDNIVACNISTVFHFNSTALMGFGQAQKSAMFPIG